MPRGLTNNNYYYLGDRLIGSNASAIKIISPRNTGDHLVWTAGKVDPMHGVCKEEEETDTRIIVIERYEIWKKGT